MNICIVGGGAAGFFAALAAKAANPNNQVILLEKTAKLLSKVRISGGGRCNVTHACFNPRELIQNYPRGSKELLGPFHKFQPSDTVEWFESRGVDLKTEADRRMFPCSNRSESIIQCFHREAATLDVDIRTQQRIENITKTDSYFTIELANGENVTCERVILATGSSPQGHAFAKALGHTIQKPVPSLFTFNIPKFPLVDLAGVAVEHAKVHLEECQLEQEGPVLITHWGLSGPAVLKLSAWGARILYEKDYQTPVKIDWLPDISEEALYNTIQQQRVKYPSQLILKQKLFPLPKSLWKCLLQHSGIQEETRMSHLSKAMLSQLCSHLKANHYIIQGKTTYKEEFVTCGGITLSEVDFRMMESRVCKGVFFAGEILDIDGVTGGFNFQNAWTTGWLAGRAATT